jgi:hypothetical protein
MWLVVTLGIAVAIVDSVAAIREGAKSRLPMIILKNAVLPILAVIVVRYLPLKDLAYPVQILIALVSSCRWGRRSTAWPSSRWPRPACCCC